MKTVEKYVTYYFSRKVEENITDYLLLSGIVILAWNILFVLFFSLAFGEPMPNIEIGVYIIIVATLPLILAGITNYNARVKQFLGKWVTDLMVVTYVIYGLSICSWSSLDSRAGKEAVGLLLLEVVLAGINYWQLNTTKRMEG